MVVVADRDIGDYIKRLGERVRMLEQRQGVTALSPAGSNSFPGGIIVGGYPVDTTSTAPTGLTLTAGVFLEQIYIDVSWTASATANEYQIEVARKVGAVYQAPTQYRTSGTAFRVENVLPDSTYGVRVYGINRLGLSSAALPAAGYTDIATSHDSIVPSAITGFTVTAGLRSLVAIWNDTADFNFDVYQLQIATNAGFTTGVRDSYVRGSIGGFTDLVANTPYWARVRAISLSALAGPWTAGASVTTGQLVGGDVPALFIDSAMIANAAILTAKIATAQITDALIVDMSVSKVLAGTITSKVFVLGSGGQFQSASITPGFVLNSQGFSLYDASAHRTVFLDSATGSATFEGTVQASIISGSTINGGTITGSLIQTAASGRRISMSNSINNEIDFFTGLATEYAPGYLQIMGINGGFAYETGVLALRSPRMTWDIRDAGMFARSSSSDLSIDASVGLDAGGGSSAGQSAFLELNSGSTAGGRVSYANFYAGYFNVDTDDPYPGVGSNPAPVQDRIRLKAGERLYLLATDDIFLTSGDDIAVTAGDTMALVGTNVAVMQAPYLKLSDGTTPAYNGDLDLAFSGPIYATTPEIAIFGGKLTVYDSGHGITVNGTNANYDGLLGQWGGSGGGIRGRSGHMFSFEWDGTNVKIWVDSTNVRTI